MLGVSPASAGLWSVGATAGSAGEAAAAIVRQGVTPTAVAGSGSVTVSWSASTLSNGVPVTSYLVARYASGTGTAQTVGAGCSGTVTGTSCTEAAVPSGTWLYAVTPVFATYWQGQASPMSLPVTVSSSTTPPSGGSVSYLNGYETYLAVIVSFAPGTDGGGDQPDLGHIAA
jgi:hypothetical protein